MFCNLFSSGEATSVIALKQRNVPVLEEALVNVSNPESRQYGQYWTQEEIDGVVCPPQEHIDGLLFELEWCGMNCEQKSAAFVCDSFNNNCVYDDRNLIDFIEIVNPYERHVMRPIGDDNGYVAREVMTKLYNITYSSVQHGASVCAVEYQNAGGFSQTDLEQQQQLNDQKKKPVTHSVGTNNGIMLETQLDLQMMSQVADGADVWYWGGQQWLYSFAVNFLNASNLPDVLSMSWGWSSRQQCDIGTCAGNMTASKYIQRVNVEYLKMGLRGVTVTVSSGDAGAPGRTNEGCLLHQPHAKAVNPAYPGSSPYITSVGATYIVPGNGTASWLSPLCRQYGCVDGVEERTCNFNETGWTAGGGFAIYNETRPSWQNKAVEKYLASGAKMPEHFQRNGRGYPDVAAVGHNCPVISGGHIISVDGTSCSSPVFAALIALLNDYQTSKGKPKLGFVNPVLYKMGDVFKDITVGNNWCTEIQCCNSSFGYEAAKGWDPVTGLGTPNFGKMAEWLDANT